MPSLSGYEATSIVRKELALNIPIIAVTADTSQQNTQKCLESGMNDCLFKPIQKDELEYILNRWLKVNTSLHYNDQMITKEIVEKFLSNIPERLDLLKFSIENQNKELLERVAHGFISASGALGVLKVSALCQSLENNAKNENFKEAKILFNELCSELVTAQEHLQEKHHLNL
jgi:CheY-like chemotaxis protein